jgi:hypothetical protein
MTWLAGHGAPDGWNEHRDPGRSESMSEPGGPPGTRYRIA